MVKLRLRTQPHGMSIEKYKRFLVNFQGNQSINVLYFLNYYQGPFNKLSISKVQKFE
jgi:hypothetical protein